MKEIPLNRGFVALVDDEDYEMVARYKWSVLTTGPNRIAVQGVIDGKHWQLHRYILKPESRSIQIDHINANALDSRRSNMRIATSRQNALNRRKISRPCTSIYRGVSLDRGRKWAVQMTIDNKPKNLGRFDCELEAARAFDDAVREHCGEWGRYNFPRDGEQSALR